jgi:hypothetical protein
MPTIGFPDAKESPFTVLMPIRNPVKLPGPIVTANPSKLCIEQRDKSNT